jgi:hypothetical protein
VFTALASIGALEHLVMKRTGRVLGVPIATLRESYDVGLRDGEQVDLAPHLYDTATVRELSPGRWLLLPAGAETAVDGRSGPGSSRVSMSWVCVGYLEVESGAGTTRFRTRVVVRLVPLSAGILVPLMALVPEPWGWGWTFGPPEHAIPALVMFSFLFGFPIYATYAARSAVLSAHHAVTSAWIAARRD